MTDIILNVNIKNAPNCATIEELSKYIKESLNEVIPEWAEDNNEEVPIDCVIEVTS